MITKRKFLFIIALFVAYVSVVAQFSTNRTTQTVVADALAQLPAENAKLYNQTMKSLIDTGEDGLLTLIHMMDASGQKSNEAPEYAISAWTNYIANHPAKSKEAAKIFGKALELPLDKTIKQFLIRQLELIGNDDNVPVLSKFLTDDYLISSAAQALVNIKTQASADALLTTLKAAKTDIAKEVLTYSVGQTSNSDAEDAVLEVLASSNSKDVVNACYAALGQIGSVKSLTVLKSAAASTNYTVSVNKATNAYVNLLQNLSSSNPKEVKKEAEALLKSTTKNNIYHVRIAALEILMSNSDVNKFNLLKKTLKDSDPAYLAKGLEFYKPYIDAKAEKQVAKSVKTTKTDQLRQMLIYWLGDVKSDVAAPVISKYLKAENKDLQKSAIRSLACLSPSISVQPLLGLLKETNAVTLTNAYQYIAGIDTDFSNDIIAGYAGFSNEGKIKALDLLALRKYTNAYELVSEQILVSENVDVKKRAAISLKNVVKEENVDQLYTLLENDANPYKSELQDAIAASISTKNKAEQFSIIQDRMKGSVKSHLYYANLAKIGSAQALNIILDGYKKSGAHSAAAFEALLSMSDFAAIHPLLEIVRDSKNANDISKAVSALIKIVSSSNQTGVVKANYLQELLLFSQSINQKRNIINHLGNTNSFQALLALEPYLDDKDLKESACQAGMKIALNNPEHYSDATVRILKKIDEVLDNPDATYQRQAIEKYFNENVDVNGYVSIFNGKDLTGWKGLVANPIKRAQMSAKELNEAQEKADKDAYESWVVQDGIIFFTGKGQNLCTEKQYGDFEMWVDWKLLHGKEPDAGIYLRGTPQVQIWDTARVKVGAQVGSGGLYNNQKHMSKPLKVADQKVGEWNTFYIKMIGDRVTVYLNGELVTDNIILENFWDRKQAIFPVEQIELQAHGSEVMYRNIYVKEIARPEPFVLSKQEEKEGFKILFDGTNIHEWTGNTTDYIAENGELVYYPSKLRADARNLYTKEEYGDFVFRFEFQLTPAANNGLGIRTPMEGDAAYVGMELQILDDDAPIYSQLDDYQYHGSVYGIIPAKRGALKPLGEWNYQEVVAKGDHIKITLNGQIIVDGNIREATKNGIPDGKEHPGLFNKKGYICFLGHGSLVKFRNIRVNRLD